MLDLVSPRRWYFLVSAVLVALGLVSLLIPPGLKLGIEFTSGSTMTIRFDQAVGQEELRVSLRELGYEEATIQRLGRGDYFLRLPEITREEKEKLEKGLGERWGGLTVLDFSAISPVIAKEIGQNAGIAVIAAWAGILLYIAWAFRRVPRPFQWGGAAVLALVHDVLIVLGSFSIMGRLFNIQVDAMFIIAVLTVVGYSINNTVVVFDRLRENLGKGLRLDFTSIVNRSLVETLGRSLNTSLTTIVALLAILLLGGVTTRNFLLALLIGLVAGTYTSLFIAPQLLVAWRKPK